MMGRFAGEESCLTLVCAVLDLLITLLKRLRYQGHESDRRAGERRID